MKRYGYVGLGIIVLAEILLYFKIEPVATFFTAIVWTGYILFIDALVYKKSGKSLIKTTPSFFYVMLLLSVIYWLVFEWYNLSLGSWEYIGLPESLPVRWFGYAWAFATIFPGIFETFMLLDACGIFKKTRCPKMRVGDKILKYYISIGVVFLILPVVFPSPYIIPFVWLGFIFLLEPLNYKWNRPSLLRDLERGSPGRIYLLLLSGFICGVLWEFWNYWAAAKWIYHVPYLENVKIFEMPVLGFFGFPPFALECFAMLHFTYDWYRGEHIKYKTGRNT